MIPKPMQTVPMPDMTGQPPEIVLRHTAMRLVLLADTATALGGDHFRLDGDETLALKGLIAGLIAGGPKTLVPEMARDMQILGEGLRVRGCLPPVLAERVRRSVEWAGIDLSPLLNV